MCRLAAFPPNFPKEKALEVLQNFLGGNTDGTGITYVKDKKFITKKYALSLPVVLKKGLGLLDHMPHNGWTIAHLRLASHGAVRKANSHPFVKGKYAICHNGIWPDYRIVKAALNKYVNWDGETDTEVAAELMSKIGPRAFYETINYGGMYLALKQKGDLWVVRTSGDLEFLETEWGTLIASELPDVESTYPQHGWYHFNREGKLISNSKPYVFQGSSCPTIASTPRTSYSPSGGSLKYRYTGGTTSTPTPSNKGGGRMFCKDCQMIKEYCQCNQEALETYLDQSTFRDDPVGKTFCPDCKKSDTLCLCEPIDRAWSQMNRQFTLCKKCNHLFENCTCPPEEQNTPQAIRARLALPAAYQETDKPVIELGNKDTLQKMFDI